MNTWGDFPARDLHLSTDTCFCIHCIFASVAHHKSDWIHTSVSLKTTGVASHLPGACGEMNERRAFHPSSARAFSLCQREFVLCSTYSGEAIVYSSHLPLSEDDGGQISNMASTCASYFIGCLFVEATCLQCETAGLL